jgi:hypothetical protein
MATTDRSGPIAKPPSKTTVRIASLFILMC